VLYGVDNKGENLLMKFVGLYSLRCCSLHQGVRNKKFLVTHSTTPLLNSQNEIDKLLTYEIDCDQIAIGLPPITSVVFVIAKSF
jgi:hypothetical protein